VGRALFKPKDGEIKVAKDTSKKVKPVQAAETSDDTALRKFAVVQSVASGAAGDAVVRAQQILDFLNGVKAPAVSPAPTPTA
jgi:hypothetical protein